MSYNHHRATHNLKITVLWAKWITLSVKSNFQGCYCQISHPWRIISSTRFIQPWQPSRRTVLVSGVCSGNQYADMRGKLYRSG